MAYKALTRELYFTTSTVVDWMDYIHLNPVRQEIVERPEDYLYSSARDYAGLKGLLKVLVEP